MDIILFLKKIEVIKSLRKHSTPSIVEESHLKSIIKKMKSYKTFERKKLFIQSLERKRKRALYQSSLHPGSSTK